MKKLYVLIPLAICLFAVPTLSKSKKRLNLKPQTLHGKSEVQIALEKEARNRNFVTVCEFKDKSYKVMNVRDDEFCRVAGGTLDRGNTFDNAAPELNSYRSVDQRPKFFIRSDPWASERPKTWDLPNE